MNYLLFFFILVSAPLFSCSVEYDDSVVHYIDPEDTRTQYVSVGGNLYFLYISDIEEN